MRLTTISALLMTMLLLAGCVATGMQTSRESKEPDLRKVGHDIASYLTSLSREPLPADAHVVTTTFVNVDDLRQSSTLGRALSGHVTSALNNLGFRVVTLNLRQSLQMRENVGELALSRNVGELMDNQTAADALITGTYYASRNHLYITSRLINPHNGEIMASHEERLPLTADLNRLMGGRQSLPTIF